MSLLDEILQSIDNETSKPATEQPASAPATTETPAQETPPAKSEEPAKEEGKNVVETVYIPNPARTLHWQP